MGISVESLLQPDEAKLLMCAICSGLLEQPVLTECGHTFCADCMWELITRCTGTRNTAPCPECRAPVSKRTIRKASYRLRQVLDEVVLSCPHKGCRWFRKAGEMDQHARRCRHALIQCRWAGCQATFPRRDTLGHLADHAAQSLRVNPEIRRARSGRATPYRRPTPYREIGTR